MILGVERRCAHQMLLLALVSLSSGRELRGEEIRLMLAEHNRYRAGEGSSNMMKMQWNHALASQASKLAKTCKFAHEFPATSGLPYKSVGQNLHATTGGLDLVTAVESWYSEKQFYDYDTDTCQAGMVCGHYTQLVWAESHLIGCAYKSCPFFQNLDWDSGVIIVCNYGPSGNTQDGLGGKRKPFVKGRACSDCTSWRSSCSDSLCLDCGSLGGNCTCDLSCDNCGTPANDTCQCDCPPGYGGQRCTDRCQDSSPSCGSSDDWSVEKCTDDFEFFNVKYDCPALCGRCIPGRIARQSCPIYRETYEISNPLSSEGVVTSPVWMARLLLGSGITLLTMTHRF